MTAGERAAAGAAICDAANALLAARLSPGAVVSLYSAKGSEVDTTRIDAFARGMGLVVAYPRVIAKQRLLAFHAVTLDELAPARFGLREPNADAPGIAVTDIAAFLVPGLAFDRSGGRIGWGRALRCNVRGGVAERVARGAGLRASADRSGDARAA